MKRRTFLAGTGLLVLCGEQRFADVCAQPTKPAALLRDAPIELSGSWGSVPPQAVALVLSRVRGVCLSGLNLLSDRQPEKLRVDNHADGPPAIWLHDDPRNTAWIIVDIGPADWCKLAYQFGHELGHVLCNSWDRLAEPRPPTQWLEEAMVEAFSIRGLARLATSWESSPPFAGNGGFAASIRNYRAGLIEKYKAVDAQATTAGIATWFRANRAVIENEHIPGAAVVAILPILEGDVGCVEDLGAVNRWSARSSIPIEDYLAEWEESCKEIGCAGRLPLRLREAFAVD